MFTFITILRYSVFADLIRFDARREKKRHDIVWHIVIYLYEMTSYIDRERKLTKLSSFT